VDFKKLSRTRSGRRFSSFSRFRARQFCNTISFAEFYREFIKLIRGALTANARKLTHAWAVCDMRFMKFVEAVDPLCIIALRRRATGGTSVNARRNFFVHLRMTAEWLCLTTCSVGYIRSKELGSRRPKAPVGANIEDAPDEAEGMGSCCLLAGTRTGYLKRRAT
jgi:hypothetical protein